MKVLVFSDSHSQNQTMLDITQREQPQLVIHLGDCTADARLLRRTFPQITVCLVRGNNDYERETLLTAQIEYEAVPMLLTHGHTYHVHFGIDRLHYAAQQAQCKIAMFGHTHLAFCKKIDGIYLLNPGSISLPRGGTAPSYARLEIANGEILRLALCQSDGQPLNS